MRSIPSRRTAAVSIQLMPNSRACRMVARESESSCGPHPKDQPPPPIAQEPNPIVVILSPLEPSGRVGNVMISLLTRISDLDLWLVHRTLLLPSTQRICHPSRP